VSLEEDRDRYGTDKPHPWVEDQYLEDMGMPPLDPRLTDDQKDSLRRRWVAKQRVIDLVRKVGG